MAASCPLEEPLAGLCRHADYSIQRLRADFDNGRTGLDEDMAEILADHLNAVVGEVFGMAMWQTSPARFSSDTPAAIMSRAMNSPRWIPRRWAG